LLKAGPRGAQVSRRGASLLKGKAKFALEKKSSGHVGRAHLVNESMMWIANRILLNQREEDTCFEGGGEGEVQREMLNGGISRNIGPWGGVVARHLVIAFCLRLLTYGKDRMGWYK